MKKIIIALIAIVSFATPASAYFDQSLSYGTSGSNVFELQEFLTTQDCFHVNPTGYFGLITLQAVKCFQTKQELPVTGYFGVMSRTSADAVIQTMTDSSTQAQITETGSTSTPPNPSSGYRYISPTYSGIQPTITYPTNTPVGLGAPSETLMNTLTIGTPVCIQGRPYQVPPVTLTGSWSKGSITFTQNNAGEVTYQVVNSPSYVLPNLPTGSYTYVATLDGVDSTGSFTIASCQ